MLAYVLSVIVFALSLLPCTHAAVSCLSPSGDKQAFSTCAFNGLGAGGASDPQEACAGNSDNTYNACMCAASTNVIKCYNTHCPGDSGLNNQIRNQADHCNVKFTDTSPVISATVALITTIPVASMTSMTSMVLPTGSLSFTIPTATFTGAFFTASATQSTAANNGLPPFPKQSGASAISQSVLFAFVAFFGVNLAFIIV